MINLDNADEIKALDKGNILDSIRALPEQFAQVWTEFEVITIPKEYKNIDSVVICGMGGSGLGARVIQSLLHDRGRIPVYDIHGYTLPNFVDQKTLVVLSSYSGNTEEIIHCAHDAEKKGAKIFGIATGGKLENYLKTHKLPGYIFEARANPSNQPRMGLGYSIGAIVTLLAKLEVLPLNEKEYLGDIESTLRDSISHYDVEVSITNNQAKTLAKNLFNRLPVIIASGHLFGVAHSFKNHLNENSKTFATLFDIPELNHHLMEGLSFPKKAKELLTFLFIKSDLYHTRIKKRYPITIDVVEKNHVKTLQFKPVAKTKLAQLMEVFVFEQYVTLYLACLNQIDPTPIPWVDYFKKQLSS